jgi:Na+/proline symporter
MHKRKITEEEMLFVSKTFNKNIKNSCFIIILLFSFFSAFLYCLFINWVEFLIIKIILIIILSFIVFLIFNSIYSIISLNRKINTCNIDRIEAEFEVENKDILTYTYETSSNSEYFKIFLINTFNNEKKRIYVEEEDYRKIKEKDLIKIIYFDKVNIPYEAIHNDNKMGKISFF